MILIDILSRTYSELEAHILDNRHSIKNMLMEFFYDKQ